MKCRLCGHEIDSEDIVCPGCDNTIDYLEEKGYLEGSRKKKKDIPADFVIDNSILKADEVYKKEEKGIPEVINMESDADIKKEDIAFDDVHTVLQGREPLVIEDNYEEEKEKVEETTLEPQKMRPKKLLFASIFLILFFIVISSTYFFMMYFSPSKIVSKSINKVLSAMENKIDGNISVETEMRFAFSAAHPMNRIYIESNVLAEPSKNLMADIYVYDGTELMSKSNIFRTDDVFYVYNRDIYDTYLEVLDMPKTNYHKFINFILNSRNFDEVEDELSKLFNNKKIKSNYSKERKMIKLADKDTKATELVLDLNNNFINLIKENENLLNTISNLFDITKEELLNYLENSKLLIYTNSYATKTYKIEFKNDNLDISIDLKDNKVSYIYFNNVDASITLSPDMKHISYLSLKGRYKIDYDNFITSSDTNLIKLDESHVPYDNVSEQVDSNIANSNIASIYNYLIKNTSVEE